jgi:hypothetical protein
MLINLKLPFQRDFTFSRFIMAYVYIWRNTKKILLLFLFGVVSPLLLMFISSRNDYAVSRHQVQRKEHIWEHHVSRIRGRLWPALHSNCMEVSFCPSHIGSIYLEDSFHAVGWDMHGCPSILRGSEGGGRNHVFMPLPAENLSRYQTDWLHLFLMCHIAPWARIPAG